LELSLLDQFVLIFASNSKISSSCALIAHLKKGSIECGAKAYKPKNHALRLLGTVLCQSCKSMQKYHVVSLTYATKAFSLPRAKLSSLRRVTVPSFKGQYIRYFLFSDVQSMHSYLRFWNCWQKSTQTDQVMTTPTKSEEQTKTFFKEKPKSAYINYEWIS